MKKVLILLTAILLPLFAFVMNADEAVKKKIPLKYFINGGKLSRGSTLESIEACYCGMISAVNTSISSDLGEVDITVTNCSTGESWDDTFDSSVLLQHILPISNTPGLYEIVYLTETGDLYEGSFIIE